MKKNNPIQGGDNSLISRDVLKKLPFGAYTINQKGDITYYNPMMEKMSGSKMSKVIGLNVFKIPNYKKVGLDKLMRKALQGESFRTAEPVKYVSYVGKKTRYRHYNGIPLKNTQGEISGILCVVEDVTEQKKAEEKANIYLKGFDSSPNSMTLVKYENREPKIERVNKAFERYYSYKEKEVLGKNPNIITSNEKPKSYYRKMWSSILNPDIGFWTDEIKNKRKDGSFIQVILSIYTIFDDHQKPKYFVANHIDISDRKKMEEELVKSRDLLDERVREKTKALAEEESRSEALLYSLGEGVIAMNPEGYILTINPAAQKLISKTGFYKKGGLISRYNFIDTEGKKLFSKTLFQNEISKKKKVVTLKGFFIGDEGEKTPLLLTLSPITNKKKVIGIAMSLRDITRENEIENAKSEFVSLASHQLRTPLSAIKWLIQAALMDKGEISSIQKEFLSDALASSERMIALVNDFLNLSRLEANIVEIKPVEVDINHFVHELVKQNRYNAKLKHQTIEFVRKPEAIPAKIDTVLTTEIINTLIANAIRYSPQREKIKVFTKEEKGHIKIQIKDNGIGIDPKEKEKIFDRFYRSQKAIKTDATGSGLGLYIAAKIIKMIGGRILVDSKGGRGSTFTIYLPKEFKSKKGKKA